MERAEITLLLLASMALLVPVGLAVHASGACRSKNASATMLRIIVGLAIAALAFWAVGAAIMGSEGRYGIIGLNRKLLFLATGDVSIFMSAVFFMGVLTLIGSSALAPAMGERARTIPVWVGTILLSAIVIPICGYWAWAPAGWLYRIGFMDGAGASVLHVTGGIMAAAGAYFVGARSNKYNTDGSSNLIPGHSTPLAAAGLGIAFVGWLPYVIGACLLHGQNGTRSAINVVLAAAAATVVSYGMSRARFGKPDVHLTLGGLLAGLVSITACAGAVNAIAAVAIGGIGGMLVLWLSVQIDMNWKIDDPSGTVAAQIVGGAWSTIAAGIFAQTSMLRVKLIGVQCLGLLAIAVFSAVCGGALFALLKRVMTLRVPEADEYDGLDLAEHDLNAYPDFQQTMIKSYHLREA